ncbi:GNAT family N-acetyltransferase [Clostridium estertheticum]|uniref:GNAT family N-acetyltransferase n=1 Tax=Clostridium estertheticum TaxID=238834 RepID=UPI001C0D08A3|nr:GNAT family N-acetyltransferase [Clostridium estertheticum]MBU3202089.1 GNAT family N-acetyltransferase [Clostridium estertheticum]WAG64803.1 GNAT family N-acetyltransferase [Clostridium estertheticum]
MLVREYRKEDLHFVAKVHIDTWNYTYANIISKDYLKNRTYEGQARKWMDRLFNNADTNEFMFVVENGNGEVVGFSSGSMNNKNCDFDSILYTLYVSKEYQKKGFGRLLVKTVASKLKDLGANNIVLWAFVENSACNFYEHLDGKRGEKRIVNIAGDALVEVSYEWDDITSLVDL